MTHLRLVRHGEVAAPHQGCFYAQLDVPLSPEGLAASLALAPELAHPGTVCVYSSPLSRARVLAQAAAQACGAPLVVEPAFAELDRGRWTGRPRAEIEAETPGAVAAYVADPERGAAPGGERESQLVARVWPALEALVARHAGRHVLLVAHAHVTRVIMARIAGWSPAESMQHFLPLLGVADLELQGGGAGAAASGRIGDPIHGRILSSSPALDQDRVLRPGGAARSA